MEDFLQRHANSVTGVLSGWDRLLFRGSLCSLSYPDGLGAFLGSRKILYKDYGKWARQLSDRLRDHAERMAERAGREFRYLSSSAVSKEQVAREIIERDGITQGLVCASRKTRSRRTTSRAVSCGSKQRSTTLDASACTGRSNTRAGA